VSFIFKEFLTQGVDNSFSSLSIFWASMAPIIVAIVVRYRMKGMPGYGGTNTSRLESYSLFLPNNFLALFIPLRLDPFL